MIGAVRFLRKRLEGLRWSVFFGIPNRQVVSLPPAAWPPHRTRDAPPTERAAGLIRGAIPSKANPKTCQSDPGHRQPVRRSPDRSSVGNHRASLVERFHRIEILPPGIAPGPPVVDRWPGAFPWSDGTKASDLPVPVLGLARSCRHLPDRQRWRQRRYRRRLLGARCESGGDQESRGLMPPRDGQGSRSSGARARRRSTEETSIDCS